MKVLVIGGGISDERDVSLLSSRSVLTAASKAGHDAEFYDWDGSSHWLESKVHNFDVVLPILHGEGGEDGQIQVILESLGAHYLGSDARSSKICIDKNKTQQMLKSHNILIPGYAVLTQDQYMTSNLSQIRHVVKPIAGGSSLDTFIDVLPQDARLAQIQKAFSSHDKMLVEEFVEGVEVTVPVLDGKKLPLIEIVPPEGQFFDYNNKYNGQTSELCPSPNASDELQQKAQSIARRVHDLLGCKHLSRVDMIINKQGAIYTLEINTMPGMTDASLFPLAAKTVGLEMPELVDYLIQLVAGQ